MILLKFIETGCPSGDEPYRTEYIINAPESESEAIIKEFEEEKGKIDDAGEEFCDLGWDGRIRLALNKVLNRHDYSIVECVTQEIGTY